MGRAARVMALFGRRSKSTPAQVRGAAAVTLPQVPVPEVTVDNLMGDQLAHRFAAELAAGRWQELHDFLDRSWGFGVQTCALPICDIAAGPCAGGDGRQSDGRPARPSLRRGAGGGPVAGTA